MLIRTRNQAEDLPSGITALPGGEGAAGYLSASSGPFLQDIASFLNNQDQSAASGKPKAFVNWILFDEQFQFVESTSNFEQVFDEGDYVDGNGDPVVKAHVITGLPMAKSGYLFVFVSNGSTNVPVYFDDLQVSHVRSPLLEETHYYPFGLTMAGISSKAAGGVQNNFKFNDGTELNNSFDINFYETSFRSLDPQIGRFWQIDPLASSSLYLSPYHYASNNPVLRNDPFGLKDTVINNKKAHIDKPLENVTVTAYTRQAKFNIYWELKRQGLPFSNVKNEYLRDWLYNWDNVQRHLDRVHKMQHESDLIVYGTVFSPLIALFAAEVATPLICQGGQLLVRIGNRYIPIERLRTLYNDVNLEIWLHGNKVLNGIKSETLAILAGVFYKNNIAQWDKLMNQRGEFKDLIGPIMNWIEKESKKPDGGTLPKVGNRLHF